MTGGGDRVRGGESRQGGFRRGRAQPCSVILVGQEVRLMGGYGEHCCSLRQGPNAGGLRAGDGGLGFRGDMLHESPVSVK